MEKDKFLFVVSGAAGTGKDSVVKALREAHPEIEKTVSATTRSPRPGEQEGVDYYYRTQEQFRQLIDTDQVVEYNFYNGNYYGTLREEVDKRLEAGKLVVLVIDVHGAANIRRMFPGATTVFLLPPSVEELEHRLRGRGTETEESIRERLATAQNELAEQDKFTLKLVNNEVASCAEELYHVISLCFMVPTFMVMLSSLTAVTSPYTSAVSASLTLLSEFSVAPVTLCDSCMVLLSDVFVPEHPTSVVIPRVMPSKIAIYFFFI